MAHSIAQFRAARARKIDAPCGRAAEAEGQNKERVPFHFINPFIVPMKHVTSASAASSSFT